MGGCVYDFIAPEAVEPVDPGTPIGFAAQIQPLFTAGCISCHKTGSTAPDLTSGNAYNAINTSKYINTSSPAQSLLYRRVVASGGFTGHPGLNASQAALLLAWIEQGAKNN